MLRISAVLAIVLSLTACGGVPRVTIKPVTALQTREICIVNNPAVKPGFLESYKRALVAKGYTVKQLEANSDVSACRVTTVYSANWKWDVALYMSYAQITVFRDNVEVGNANYDARRGRGNMSKFGEADTKIADLVNQLFPGNAR
ncbi:Sbal_3080 family lipoprotein [Massilia sp. CF038]|uniref:Sbal_3080 family lipoprotein n=1 Tax=Massilia sp. CF038 TaxID=1881045 RepID=UPI00091AFD9C|nr:Sbal_3080 family lipoprotein [Massilia sp. CF038]SHH51492.1 hypothetical protein SAMN05428948_4243 [Massilia sp. CF038]